MNKVELEFKRIQTYLFASPRLRAMLGANATLGRTVRVDLLNIAKACGAKADESIADLMPCADQDDPLVKAVDKMPNREGITDDPASIYRTYGVLIRDGGHFIASFPNEASARAFIEQANVCITEKLPGILIEARLDGNPFERPTTGECLFQHAGFQVSQHLGNRPAKGLNTKKDAFVSAEEEAMEAAGKKFRDQPTDLIALLEKSRSIPCPAEPPESLSDIANGDYLALIHADGNGIGSRYKDWMGKSQKKEGSLEREAHGEKFFHSMRVAVRKALVSALNEVFVNNPKSYQLLMLGGDDLLLVCAAEYALPFVCAYAKALAQEKLSDSEALTVGAGVIIAKETFPFHRLHAMAEALADSAKRRYRAEPSLGSVVDWHVTSSSWIEDPIKERQADSLTDSAVLSGKPYPVLGSYSLDSLLKHSEEIRQDPKVARSQLRALVETMRQGPKLAELAWRELPEGTYEPLVEALKKFDQNGLFRSVSTAPDSTRQVSVLPDIVELLEIKGRPSPATKDDAS